MRRTSRLLSSLFLVLALVLSTVPLSLQEALAASAGEDTPGPMTYDSGGFFQGLDADASTSSKFGLSALEKLGIYFNSSDAQEAGVTDTHVTKSGAGSIASPASSAGITGANLSYTTLYTITIDSDTFERGAGLTYVNNNVTVSYNKRDVIQAVLYAIESVTQQSSFNRKTMYRVVIDYKGSIELTNSLFIYSNTWLRLGSGTNMLKQFQSSQVSNSRPGPRHPKIPVTDKSKRLTCPSSETVQGNTRPWEDTSRAGISWSKGERGTRTSRRTTKSTPVMAIRPVPSGSPI